MFPDIVMAKMPSDLDISVFEVVNVKDHYSPINIKRILFYGSPESLLAVAFPSVENLQIGDIFVLRAPAGIHAIIDANL